MQTSTLIQGLESEKIIDCFKCLEAQIDSLKHNFQPKEPTQLLTRSDVAELLSISLPTVNEWSRKGILQPYRLANRVYFKRHEVEAALKSIKAKGGKA